MTTQTLATLPKGIYPEPADIDADTLEHLGPLRPLAGVWEGPRGLDVHPVAEGTEETDE